MEQCKISFKYRLYPSPAQGTTMKNTLEECRWLYNHFLEERNTLWKQHQHISLYDQEKTLPILKQERPSLNIAYSQVFQDVVIITPR